MDQIQSLQTGQGKYSPRYQNTRIGSMQPQNFIETQKKNFTETQKEHTHTHTHTHTHMHTHTQSHIHLNRVIPPK